MLKTPGAHRWRRLRFKRVNADGSFATWPRYLRDVRAARFSGRHRYTLHHLHISPHVHRFKVRAVVRHAGRSNIVTVRLRHKRAHAVHHKRTKKHTTKHVKRHHRRHHQRAGGRLHRV
jgi:hypothetical protein